MTYRVVPMTEQLIPGFRAAVDSVARERRYLAMLEAPSMKDTRAFVLSNLAAGVSQFVAIADDHVVGWCDVLPKPRATLKHSGVLGVGVVAPYRGRGIGRSLIGAALQAAKSNGLTRIELTVRIDNDAARKLYESFGFVTEGLLKHHMRIDGNYHDSYSMALLYELP